MLSSNPGSSSHKKKHICYICSETFERSYQLKRHQFVEHYLDEATQLHNITSHYPLVPESHTSNFETTPSQEKSERPDLDTEPVIKNEKSNEEITNEKSLLIPLFEVMVNDIKNEANNSLNGFPLVKCKEEPEEHMEDITARSFSLDNDFVSTEERSRKRKPIDQCLDEDTDSATETLLEEAPVKKAKQKRIELKNMRLTKNTTHETKKTVRSKYGVRKTKRDNKSPVIPVKISEAKKFMEGWKTLSINIVDLSNFKNKYSLL